MSRSIFALILLALAGCSGVGPSEFKGGPFASSWKFIDENGISGAKETTTVTAVADGEKFKIDMNSEGYRRVQIYDGDMLYMRDGDARKPEKPELAQARFWTRRFQGKTGAGGKIAGRDTTLYQAQARRPDGEFTVQAWVDSETGLPLKTVETVFSKQVNSMVTKMTKECQTIRYGAVDPASFKKPN